MPEGTDVRLVMVTFPDAQTALAVGRRLVDDRLAACVNVLPGVRSVYRWEGAVESGEEVLALVKTQALRLPALLAAIRAAHPYDLPVIEVLPVLAVSEGVAAWISAATGG